MKSLAFLTACVAATAGCSGQDKQAETPDAAVEPKPDAPPVQPPFNIDVFKMAGHAFKFEISETQAKEMEQDNGGCCFGDDEYQLPGLGHYADELVVTDAETGQKKNFGKVELSIVGQSSRRPWRGIPSLRMDADEFTKGQKIGDQEYLRFNNGQVSGIYREAIALRVWKKLGYPAPRTTFAWVKAPNQWGDVKVPYTVIEPYKKSWCDSAFAPNTCKNIWEHYGNLSQLVNNCQVAECDDARLIEFVNKVQTTSPGPGYEAATSQYVDWDAYRSFQCLSWITGTGDDYVHNLNNIVLVERSDGKFQFLPYSTDISAGQRWYPNVQLEGISELSQGCQNDPTCWNKMVTRCKAMITQFEQGDIVNSVVKPVITQLKDAEMERSGDEQRAAELVQWYTRRATDLRNDPILPR